MKVGIIGLGEVAQLMHIPLLHDMGDEFTLTAVFDVSPSLSEFVGSKYGVTHDFADPRALIEKSDTDIIFVLSPDQYHCQYIEWALEAGKHVFVEKPAALYSAELERLVETKKKYPHQIVMVGYMRRYADNFLKAKELLVQGQYKTEYLRFRDIICEGPFFIGQTRPVYYPKDIPSPVLEESRARRSLHLDEALGKDAPPALRTAYQMLTGLGCHSFSAVRELFGVPQILSVTTSPNGEQLIIVMEFNGFLGVYELLNNQDIVQFDAAIEIFQKNRKLTVKYETPYIRHQPMSLEVIESVREDTKTTLYGPSWRDPFYSELREFAACIREKREPKTNLADALWDLRLFEQITAILKREIA
jgi:predicted dehydrogenase